jgi:uracil-DNA glycosylase
MKEAHLDPAECFFTNALIALKQGSAAGSMPSGPEYVKQCRQFLLRQIEIVEPRAIVSLGGDAEHERRIAHKRYSSGSAIRADQVMHPSTRPKDQLPDPDKWIAIQGRKIRDLLR